MLQTLEATLLPSGVVTFSEPLPVDHPIPVLITLLERVPEPSSTSLPIAEPASPTQEQPATPLKPIADEEPARTELWKRLMALREQAIAEGMQLMTWDEINAEVRRRRGGASDE